MAITRFVDPVNGSDSTGTGAVAAPWKTIQKALGPTPALTLSGSGQDVLALVPSGPCREANFLISVTPTSSNTLLVVGDVDGTYQQAAGAATVYTGDALWTAHNNANAPDLQAPHTGSNVNLNGKSYITFSQIAFIAGSTGSNGACIDAHVAATTSQFITIQKCAFFALCAIAQYTIRALNVGNNPYHWTIDSCVFMPGNSSESMWFSLADPAQASDLDVDVTIKNCLVMGMNGAEAFHVEAPGTATGGGKAGGVRVRNCTIFVGGYGFNANGANLSTSIPCEIHNCVLLASSSFVLRATTAGALVEDFNWFLGVVSSVQRSNVTAGANSLGSSQASPYFEVGQAQLWGRFPRPMYTPLTPAGMQNPALGWGNGGTNPAPPTVDLFGRPRPSGGGVNSVQASDSGTATGTQSTTTLQDTGKAWTVNAFTGFRVRTTGGTGSGQYRWAVSNTTTTLTVNPAWTTTPDATTTYSVDNPGKYPAIGYTEMHEFGRAGGSAQADGGAGDCIRLAGPGDHDLYVPVGATPTTISIKQKTSNYTGTSYPQIAVLDNPEIGVAGVAAAQDSAANTSYTVLTIGPFTPARAGVVVLRLQNRTDNGSGVVYWDTVSVTPATTTGLDVFRRGEPFQALVQGAATGGLRRLTFGGGF